MHVLQHSVAIAHVNRSFGEGQVCSISLVVDEKIPVQGCTSPIKATHGSSGDLRIRPTLGLEPFQYTDDVLSVEVIPEEMAKPIHGIYTPRPGRQENQTHAEGPTRTKF